MSECSCCGVDLEGLVAMLANCAKVKEKPALAPTYNSWGYDYGDFLH